MKNAPYCKELHPPDSKLCTSGTAPMTITWTPSHAIDNGIIDEDHRAIIQAISSIYSLLGDNEDAVQILAATRELRTLAEAHFAREEHLQELLDFPNRDAHRDEHIDLLNEIDLLLRELETAAEKVSSAMRFQLKGFFHRWILDHALASDLEMQPYLAPTISSDNRIWQADNELEDRYCDSFTIH